MLSDIIAISRLRHASHAVSSLLGSISSTYRLSSMIPGGTLWATPQQYKGKAIKAAALLGGISLDCPSSYEHHVDNLKPEFLRKFSHGKIPAFESQDGKFRLFESLAVARYIASLSPKAGLLGHSKQDAALVDQWLHFVETEVDVYTELVDELCSGSIPYTRPEAVTLFLTHQLRGLATLEEHLTKHAFFVGERLTLADLYIASLMQKAVALTMDPMQRAKLPNIVRHLETVVNQPALKGVYGEIEYCNEALRFVPPSKTKK